MVDDSVAVTPFYLLLGKHRRQQLDKQEALTNPMAERTQLPQGSIAIKEVCLCVYSCNVHWLLICWTVNKSCVSTFCSVGPQSSCLALLESLNNACAKYLYTSKQWTTEYTELTLDARWDELVSKHSQNVSES